MKLIRLLIAKVINRCWEKKYYSGFDWFRLSIWWLNNRLLGGEPDWLYYKDLTELTERVFFKVLARGVNHLVKKAETFGIRLKRLKREELSIFKEYNKRNLHYCRAYSDKKFKNLNILWYFWRTNGVSHSKLKFFSDYTDRARWTNKLEKTWTGATWFE